MARISVQFCSMMHILEFCKSKWFSRRAQTFERRRRRRRRRDHIAHVIVRLFLRRCWVLVRARRELRLPLLLLLDSRSTFHGCVGIRKALKAVSQVLDGRVEGDRRGSPRYLYNAGRAGLVGGAGYLTRRLGVGFCIRHIWQDVPQYKMIV